MNRVSNYLLSQFISVFASLFFTLFFITSIVYFIQIARITSVIQITFFELTKLYLFLLPKILIFTLPVTFFIALTVMLFKLSRENETIVLFTLGYSSKKIAKFFTIISLMLSIFLSINVLVLMPLSTALQSNFIQYKRAEAKFNIRASEFGQKFSDWLVFVNDSGPDRYKDIVMYSKDNNKDSIIASTEAKIVNDEGEIRLELSTGKAYDVYSKSINQLDFNTMIIRSIIDDNVAEVGNFKDYWIDIFSNQKKGKDFTFYLLLALFPLSSVLFALSFGIVTYRYQRGGIYIGISTIIITYFTATFLASSFYPVYSLAFVFLLFSIISIIYFKNKILNHF